MTTLTVTSRVPDALAAKYRAEGWWDDRGLADGLEAGAQRKPDAVAVADNDHELSYAELVARVNGAIAELAERDVGTNTGVVLVTGNTVDAVVAYHALAASRGDGRRTRPSESAHPTSASRSRCSATPPSSSFRRPSTTVSPPRSGNMPSRSSKRSPTPTSGRTLAGRSPTATSRG